MLQGSREGLGLRGVRVLRPGELIWASGWSIGYPRLPRTLELILGFKLEHKPK